MKITTFLLVFGLTISQLVAQQIQRINPTGLFKSPNYSQVVAVQGGRTIYVSGQVSVNAQGDIVGKGDFRAQTKQVHENLKTALAAVGATFDDVVKLTALWLIQTMSDLASSVKFVVSITMAHNVRPVVIWVFRHCMTRIY